MGRPTIARSIKRRRLDAQGVENYNDAGHAALSHELNTPAAPAPSLVSSDNPDALIAALIAQGYSVSKKAPKKATKKRAR